MIDLINTTVTHKIFGDGKVINKTNNYITVLFDTFEKEFVYPSVFEDFLMLKDTVISDEVHEVINIKAKEDLKLKEKKDLELKEKQDKELKIKQEELRIIFEKSNHKSTRKISATKKKSDIQRNIAFKCIYCDGGNSLDQIGYDGVCSDETIKDNIEKKKHLWCSDENNACLHYHNGELSRTALDNLMDNGDDEATVCYESQMLKNWKASAGMIQNGANKGKPLKLKNVHYNSLALLTTRLPSTKEADRIIFGAFIVDDIFEGNEKDEGYVSSKSDYKIQITLKEAQKMKFWNYYFNPNNPESIRMGSGLFRYLNDEQSIQILRDFVKLKEKTSEAESAQSFLDHFCLINGINIDTIPVELMGGLQR
ncbi:MAG: hypothetical protein ACOH15_06725 [Acetobacterium sp.]